jgi:hypothetical protein
MRRLDRLWLSLADMTRLSSSTPLPMARSAPRTFGTSALYTTPGTRSMVCITSCASASAGMAFGETKAVTSILATPVRDSRLTKAIFWSVGTNTASACKPSRVPTSCR